MNFWLCCRIFGGYDYDFSAEKNKNHPILAVEKNQVTFILVNFDNKDRENEDFGVKISAEQKRAADNRPYIVICHLSIKKSTPQGAFSLCNIKESLVLSRVLALCTSKLVGNLTVSYKSC